MQSLLPLSSLFSFSFDHQAMSKPARSSFRSQCNNQSNRLLVTDRKRGKSKVKKKKKNKVAGSDQEKGTSRVECPT